MAATTVVKATPVTGANDDGKWVFVPIRDKGKAEQAIEGVASAKAANDALSQLYETAPLRRATVDQARLSSRSDEKTEIPASITHKHALYRLFSRKPITAGEVLSLAPFFRSNPEMVSVARGILGSREYAFRLVQTATLTISSNVTAGTNVFSPLGLAEWSGLLDALFDEYRVDKMIGHYTPVLYSGSSVVFNEGRFAVGSDYDQSVTPASFVIAFNYADGKCYPAMVQSASGYFISNAALHTHVSKIPRTVAAAGSVASVEWLDTDSAWPGGQVYYANTTGTNGTGTIIVALEYFVKLRMRK